MSINIPRGEYPRPQCVRSQWLCLNGTWQFEIDHGDSGLERGLVNRELSGEIIVPFCPESSLSGVGNTDFMPAVWYRRIVDVPANWNGKRILLHLQACDYDTTVWVNGQMMGRHRGGFTPFTLDITKAATPGEKITLVVRARDDYRTPQPRGKQSQRYDNYGCMYTRTTGIWQTVWLEPVAQTYLLRPRLTPDLANSMIRLEQPIAHAAGKLTLRAQLSDAQGQVAAAQCEVKDFSPRLDLPIPADRRRLWEPGNGQLYDVTIELLDANGAVIDTIGSYAGLRSVAIDGKAVLINGKSVFQRLVLDQGYYPDGILTAPTEAALVHDIQLSLDAGFNGARLHQKVFEERFLYHADRMGYLVWGEFGDWGCWHQDTEATPGQQLGAAWITQWLEALMRDYSHPSIVGWCGLNETARPVTDHIGQLDDVTRGSWLAAKAMDPTRPVLDSSGYSHRVLEADIYDSHDYEQDVAKFRANHAGTADGKPFINDWGKNVIINIPYSGQPYFCSEFGGIWWNPDAKPGEPSWGYGDRPTSLEQFYQRFEGLCAALLENPAHFGYCYTQLTDVYQEQNGVVRFDRSMKFDLTRLRAAQQKPAAIEKCS